MIPKQGKDRKELASYRFISLLSYTTKVGYTMLLIRIKEKEKKLGVTPGEQRGFKEDHSTEDQVMSIVNDAIIYFDVEKTND